MIQQSNQSFYWSSSQFCIKFLERICWEQIYDLLPFLLLNWTKQMKSQFQCLWIFLTRFSEIWYLKLFVSLNKSLNGSSILVLLVVSCTIGSFLLTNLTLYDISFLWMLGLFLHHLNLHKKEVQKANQYLFILVIFRFPIYVI